MKSKTIHCNIVSFCWNNASQHHSALVATTDGQIWNIPLSHPTSPDPSINPSTTASSSIDRDPLNTPIKIEDSDEEVEEVELWNDEDGLLDSADVLDSLSPAKRPRIESPPEIAASARGAINPPTKVKPIEHFVGQEDGVTKIVTALNGLLIFRRNKDPVLWSSQHGFRPGTPVVKTVIVDANRADTTCHVVDGQSHQQIFYGTNLGEIYHSQPGKDEGAIDVQKLNTRMQGAISSLVTSLHGGNTQAKILTAISSIGDIVTIGLEPSTKTSEHAIVKMTIGAPVRSAFLANDHVYFLTTESRILRAPYSSLDSGKTDDLELLDLPLLHAFVPVPYNADSTEVCGFYGLNHEGQVLWFQADLSNIGRSKAASDARDNVSEAIRELDKLSERVRQLELESQVGSTILKERDKREEEEENGGLALNLSTSPKTCPHMPESTSTQNSDVTSSLEGLSPQAPWAQDIEIDMQSFSLPLTITLGLQFDDFSKTSKDNRLRGYFPVESLDLDVIHFSEPVRDRVKQNPAYYTQALAVLRDVRKSEGDPGKLIERLPISTHKQEKGREECKECARMPIRPLVFDIDTMEIKIAQCLPALLGDGVSHDRVKNLVHSSNRASLSIPDECLPMIKPTRLIRKPPVLTQCDASLVWLMLEVKESTGSIVQVSINIRGVDHTRVLAVYHALEKRVFELFG
ncbi:hypothetical protein BGX21_010346 [Mortierella sp. AD011]|nr:hypothetical protein BGX20_010275 [Mortierella sp. AD010]KAF9394524.1 hypothetical protein BGX21_010346 [Mortierella sp. AD011]